MKGNVSKKGVLCIVSSRKAISEHWKNEKNYYLSHEKSITSQKENVMERFYGIPNNKYQPVLLKEITLDGIIHKYGENGFVYISTRRSDSPDEFNDRNTRNLICDIMNSGYSYLPAYGGYRNNKTGECEVKEFEPSVIVFNYKHNGEPEEFTAFHSFARNICERYAQYSAIFKYPNLSLEWGDKNGNVVRFSDGYKECVYDISHRLFVNPIPISLIEEQLRRGEIMIWRV